MTFENLSKIVDGVRLNTPLVNAYEKIETKPHLIKQGDLFVGSDPKEILEAIEHGAYGILCEKEPIMIDEEVAWIQVTSTDDALIKILRFSLLKSEALFFYFPTIEYAILKQILQKKSIVFIDEPIEKNFKKILTSHSDSFFISDNKHFLEQIYPEFISYHDRKTTLLKLTHQTLFLSSFTYEEVHYEEIKLPALFLPQLNTVLHYLKESQLDFDIHKLSFVEHFNPLFVSNKLTIQPFGHSEHAFIVEPDEAEIASSFAYLQQYATWAKVLVFLPKESPIKITDASFVKHYNHIEEVNNIEIDRFNFILILANYNELTNVLEKNRQVTTVALF
jgi:ferrochelatase